MQPDRRKKKERKTGEGGHSGGRRPFDNGAGMAKDTIPPEVAMAARIPKEFPAWDVVSPGFYDERSAVERGADPSLGAKDQIYMNDTRHGLGDARSGVGKPAIRDDKIGFATASRAEMEENDPNRGAMSKAKKAGWMWTFDHITKSSSLGVRTVAGTGLSENRLWLGMKNPEGNLKEWAVKNGIDSRCILAAKDTLRQFRRAAEDTNNPTWVAGSELSVVGRMNAESGKPGAMVAVTTNIDVAHPTMDKKFRADYINAVNYWIAAHDRVAKSLQKDEARDGTRRTSPVYTNNRYDQNFAPSHRTLQPYSELHKLGKLVESVSGSVPEQIKSRTSTPEGTPPNASPQPQQTQVDSLSRNFDRSLHVGEPLGSMVPTGMAAYSTYGSNMTPPSATSELTRNTSWNPYPAAPQPTQYAPQPTQYAPQPPTQYPARPQYAQPQPYQYAPSAANTSWQQPGGYSVRPGDVSYGNVQRAPNQGGQQGRRRGSSGGGGAG